jgi:2,3-dihydroxybenzoate-AMP ligase
MKVTERFGTIGAELSAIARSHPDTEAVVDPFRRLTFAELDSRTDAIACGLHALGLNAGDPVLLQVGNRVETVEGWYGIIKAGALPVCTLPAHGRHELEAIGNAVRARAHLVDADAAGGRLLTLAADLRQAVPSLHLTITARGRSGQGDADLADLAALTSGPPPLETTDSNAIAVIQLSGGTTALPKPIPRRHAEYWYNALATAERFDLRPGDRIAHVLPLVHNAGIHGALHAAHSVGATLLVADRQPEQFIPFLVAENADSMVLVPGFVISLLDRSDFKTLLSSLRRLSLSAAVVPPALFDRLEELGVNVVQQFGMGEGFCTGTPIDAPREMRRDTVGFPLSPEDVFRVVDDKGRRVADGEVGELQVSGPYTITGYLGGVGAAAFAADGSYRTGDLVRVHEVGGKRCLAVAGRIKDLINRGGEKVNAEELELLLVQVPGVQSAAAVAMPDEKLGERTCVFVVPNPGAKIELGDLTRALADRGVAKYKWPERLEIVDELPRTPVGKVSKVRLRETVAALLAGENEGSSDASR